MAEKFYVTTAIDYCNDVIHIGHAFQKVVADVYARYHRLIGDEVFFLTGTDEYGSKAEQAAQKKGISPKELVDQVSRKDQEQLDSLNISYDRFIRTTDKDHKKTVQAFWKKSREAGDIYLGNFTGLYCVGCEAYITDSDLIDGVCPYHKKPPKKLTEKNYFFRWSKYQDFLYNYISSHETFVLPEKSKNEMLGFLKQGLEDMPISRTSISWGIPVPDDPKHVIYVWFDALINYITGAPKGFWPADIHFLGVDNLRFHALLWPAMLKSAGYEQPKTVYGHGFFSLNGQKMSKSLGNIVRPTELTEIYGADPVRYYLLKVKPLSDDGDVSLNALDTLYQGELANGIGNITLRLTKLAEKLTLQGIEPIPAKKIFEENEAKRMYQPFCQFRPNETIKELAREVNKLDKKIEHDQPWKTIKTDKKKAQKDIQESLQILYRLAVLFEPFIPESAQKIQKNVVQKNITTKAPLFPRL